MRSPSRKRRDSRQAIFESATFEFAARGFDGASVDRISARAAANKAMIYYHFGSKVRLYREILRDIFDSLYRRTADIARSQRTPDEKIGAFVEAMIHLGQTRPAFPRIMAREVADGGRHLDPETVRLMARIPQTVAAMIQEGVAAGRFRDVQPFLCYFSLIGPIILYQMSEPLRTVVAQLKLVDTERLRTEAFVAHMKTFAGRALRLDEVRDERPDPTFPRPAARRSRANRPGEHV